MQRQSLAPISRPMTSRTMRLLVLQLLLIATARLTAATASCPQLSRITNAELSALRSNRFRSLPLSGLLIRLWCQDNIDEPAAGNYVNISFSQPVAIHGIITRGSYHETLGENYHSYIRRSTFSYYNETSLVTLPVSMSVHHMYMHTDHVPACRKTL